MPNPNSNLADVELIGKEFVRFAKMTPEQLFLHLKENRRDALCTLEVTDRGEMIIGCEAQERFWAIAKRFFDSHPDKKARVHLDEFVNALRSEFSDRFLKQGRDVDQSNVDKMISVAYKRVARDFQELEHFIPVNLFMTNTAQPFQVGPVAFVKKAEFFSRYQSELDAQRIIIETKNRERTAALIEEGYSIDATEAGENAILLGNRLVDGLITSFSEHSWFAIVTISPCDALISYEKALFLTRGALNILKLLLGANYTDRLRTVEDHGHRTKGAKLSRKKGGELEISLSFTPQDNVIDDQWLEVLSNRFGPWFKMASDLLDLCRDLDAAPQLCVRFVDALAWYGDAIAERSTAPKIVKFVSAVERLVCTGKEHDANGRVLPLADIVIPRAGVFYADGQNLDLALARKEVEDIYEARSNIVHGSISPFDESLRSVAARAHDATRTILLLGLEFFISLGITDRSVTEKKLREQYVRLVSSRLVPEHPVPPPNIPASE